MPALATANPPEIAVWTDAEHARLAADVLDLLGGLVRPIAVGASDGSAGGQLADWAKTLDAKSFRDLRKLRIDRPAGFLLAACTEPPAAQDLRELAADGTTVLLLQPPADDDATLDALAAPEVARRLALTPRFEACPGWRAAADPPQAFLPKDPQTPNRPACVHMTSHGRPDQGSLFTRAFDAWRVVLKFAPLPETIDASVQRPGTRPAPQRPAELTGRLTAHARCADGSSITLQLSDRAQEPQRRLRVTADPAELEITDGHYQLATRDPEEGQHDPPAAQYAQREGSSPASPDAGPDHSPFADLVAGHFRRLLDRPPLAVNPAADRNALACVRACQLSAKTGQPERPGQMLLANL